MSDRLERISGEPTTVGVVDSCVFHEWASVLDLTPYMPSGWSDLLTRQGDTAGPVDPRSQWVVRNPLGDTIRSPHDEPSATDVGLVSEVFARTKVERIVLGYHEGLLATAFPQAEVAKTVVAAANDWTLDRWLSRDARLGGLILVSSIVPEDAAAEIRRQGSDPRFVGVAIGANALGRPFGHPIYEPIYAAAAELGLPIVIQAGSDATTDSSSAALAGGRPATYAEYHAQSAGVFLSHVTSMIVNGIFERFPSLQLLLLGGGVCWVPSFLWRLGYFSKLAPADTVRMRRPAPDYFLTNVRLSTYSLEAPRSGRLRVLLDAIPDVESVLLYGSGYPRWDMNSPGEIAGRLPAEWHDGVFRDNALTFFRWPSDVRSSGHRALQPA